MGRGGGRSVERNAPNSVERKRGGFQRRAARGQPGRTLISSPCPVTWKPEEIGRPKSEGGECGVCVGEERGEFFFAWGGTAREWRVLVSGLVSPTVCGKGAYLFSNKGVEDG